MARIPLRDRSGGVRAYALVDDADLPLVESVRWHLDGAGYVRHSQHAPRRAVFMHRLIMGEPNDTVEEAEAVARAVRREHYGAFAGLV